MTTPPFYFDWTFWTALLALLALVLSQFPPISILLRRARLNVEAFERIHVAHSLGDPNATLHLVITNSGGREVKIKSIVLNFHRDGDDQFELKGRGYYQSPADQSAVILTPFRLKPDEEWSHMVNFFSLRSNTEEREVNQIKSTIRNSIAPRKSEPGNDKVFLEAPSELVKPATDYFQRKFRWNSGEYEVTLNVVAEPSEASTSQQYRITVFESDNKQLVDETKRYIYGAGVYFSDREQVPIFLPLVPLTR